VPLVEMRVDGGAAANDFLMQFQADLLGRPVGRPKMLETTAFGAAALAGLAVGVWKDGDEIRARIPRGATYEPSEDVSERRADWQRAVRRALLG
jgi:glycerol kinase